MNLHDTTGADANRLPYFVMDGAGNRVTVEFAPLIEADKAEIEGADWIGSVFREAWMQWCGVPPTIKLVEKGGASPILGLVRPGVVPEGDLALRGSILETTPALRFRVGSVSPLRGVGRVLLARLVVESYNQGANGALYIKSRPEAYGFYDAVGLVASPRNPGIYRLHMPEAALFFEKGTL